MSLMRDIYSETKTLINKEKDGEYQSWKIKKSDKKSDYHAETKPSLKKGGGCGALKGAK